MDCKTLTITSGYTFCEHFDKCRGLKISLCEVDQEFHQPNNQTSRPWSERKQQVLELAKEKGIITTTMIMEHTNAAHGTVCNWLSRLTIEGDLQRLTRAVLSGVNSRPATFAIAHKED